MPAPEIEFEVINSTTGRRIIKEQAEQAINAAFAELFDMLAGVEKGDKGDTGDPGDRGEQGPAWITTSGQRYNIGDQVPLGGIVYRYYPASGEVGLFRAISDVVISNTNFPEVPEHSTMFELILVVPEGPQGEEGDKGDQGDPGQDIVVREFTTDADAIAFSQANPLALVISTEGF